MGVVSGEKEKSRKRKREREREGEKRVRHCVSVLV